MPTSNLGKRLHSTLVDACVACTHLRVLVKRNCRMCRKLPDRILGNPTAAVIRAFQAHPAVRITNLSDAYVELGEAAPFHTRRCLRRMHTSKSFGETKLPDVSETAGSNLGES